MPSKFDPLDKSRTSGGKTHSLVSKHTAPPKEQGGWMAVTREFLEADAYCTLSVNARRCLDRLKIEHIGHNRRENGRLTVTHAQFIAYGATSDLIADALEELAFKGLVKMQKGRAGDGTPHATIYTLTFDGTHDGAPATNEWRKVTRDDAKRWVEVERQKRQEKRARGADKEKSPLGNHLMRPLGKHLIGGR